MNELVRSVGSLFSVFNILFFIAGALCEYVFLKLRCRYLNKHDPNGKARTVKLNRDYVIWALVLIVIGGLTYKAQVTSDQVIAITRETQNCSKQFNAALKARADIGAEERDINARWQDVTFDRAGKLTQLVVEYGDVGNPEYLKARVDVDREYYNKINQIFQDRNRTTQARVMLGGYPEPTCGR